MIISIDGPAGSGKSTIATILAENLGFIHFNSGSLYRGITAYLLEQDFDFSTIQENFPIFNLNLELTFENKIQNVYVNGKNYTKQLRDNIVSTHTPLISVNKSLRSIIDNCQRKFCYSHNIVIEGRDIGSFVFPDAEIKFYLDCAVKERAKRRFLEEKSKNNNITIEEIEQQIIERDNFDKNRPLAPLVIPKNAIMIDSSNQTINQVVSEMLSYINTLTI